MEGCVDGLLWVCVAVMIDHTADAWTQQKYAGVLGHMHKHTVPLWYNTHSENAAQGSVIYPERTTVSCSWIRIFDDDDDGHYLTVCHGT